MGARIDQTTPTIPTNEFAAEDESITTNKAASVVPLLIGEGKTTIRWLSPIYGQRVVNLPSSSGGGKGGKGGAGNTRKEYHGTIAGAIGEGPAYSLEWIIVGGKKVWWGGLYKPAESDYSDITLTGVGPARLYWGTETQTPDPTLTAYEDHPGYRGWFYIVLKDCSWGENTGPLTIEVGWRRSAQQLIVTGGPSAIDGNATAVPATVAAELFTSWSWGNLPAEKINGDSFQAIADALYVPVDQSVPETNQVKTSVAPLYNEQMTLGAALSDLGSVAKIWIRMGVDGRIEAGRWRRDGDLTNVQALNYNDVESARFDVDPADDLPNSFLVEFRDASKHHKVNCVTVDNTAAIRSTGRTRRQTANRSSLLTWLHQAQSHGSDLLRDAATPTLTVVLSCRRHKAVNPDGTAIRPGDYFTFPVEEPGEPADVRLFRCIRRSFEPTGPIELTGEAETSGTLRNITPEEVSADVDPVTPPLNYSRIISFISELENYPLGVRVLAARPTDLAYGVDVHYCSEVDGDYAYLATQRAFALPLTLVQALSDVATTIRVKLITGADGVNARRDAALLLNWNGGAVEAANNTLILCVVKKDGGGSILERPDGRPWIELLSVAGPPSAVATDTYDVPILRGRVGDISSAFTTGSFPDNWTNYEVWCLPFTDFFNMVHLDFPGLGTTGAPGYFRLIPVSKEGTYDPDLAWTERQRRLAESLDLAEFAPQTSGGVYHPEITFTFPDPTIPPPTGLTLTSGNATVATLPDGTKFARLLAEWTPPADAHVQTFGLIRIQYKKSSDSEWRDWATVGADQSSAMILDVMAGDEHDVRIQTQMAQRFSVWETETNHEVLGDTNAPSALTGVVATAYPGYIRVTWPASSETDIGEYKVFKGTSTSFGSAVEIGETPGLMWDDPDVTAGTTYRYWIVPIDRSENAGTQSNRADAAAIGAPLGDITPSSPTAMTKTGEGVRVAGDGRVSSYMLFTLPGKPSDSIRVEMLYRVAGTAQWTTNGQYTSATSTSNVPLDDLVPGLSYDVATRAWSASKASSIVTATSSPFTAPNRSAPAAPTGLTLSTASADMNRVPPLYFGGAGGPKYGAALLKWTPSVDPHAYQEIRKFSTLPGTPIRIPAGVSEWPVYDPLNFQPVSGDTMQVRAVAPGTNTPSAWANHDLAFTTVNYGTEDMAEQASDDVDITGGSATGITDFQTTGIKTGSSGASQVKVRQIGEANVTLTGGAVDERKTVSISGKGFSTKPDHGTAWATSFGTILVSYDKLNGSSNSSNAVFYFQMKDGSNLPGISLTFTYELIEI